MARCGVREGGAVLRALAFAAVLSCARSDMIDVGVDVQVTDLPSKMPAAFRARVAVTALLLEEGSVDPPRERLCDVWFDAAKQRSKVTVLSGLDANKTFLRRWDTGYEYCYREDEYTECRREFLVEPMPVATLPTHAAAVHRRLLPGTDTQVLAYTVHHGPERVLFFVDEARRVPLAVQTEYVHAGEWQPVMRWQIEQYELAVTDADFDLPPRFSHDACERSVGGWPYLHMFSHYLRV